MLNDKTEVQASADRVAISRDICGGVSADSSGEEYIISANQETSQTRGYIELLMTRPSGTRRSMSRTERQYEVKRGQKPEN